MDKNPFRNFSEDEEDLKINWNNDYAKSYNKSREKEFYSKLKQQCHNSDDTSSSDSESSDEDEDVDAVFNTKFFETLSSLKNENPIIYDKNTTFFDEPKTTDKQIQKKKKLTIKDYERKIIVEKHGKFDDDDNEHKNKNLQNLSHSDEQELKNEFTSLLTEHVSDEEFGGIFKKREKTFNDENYENWLAGSQQTIDKETERKLNPLKKYWSSPNLSKQEIFLRDYLLNKGYSNNNEIPTYDEIVNNGLLDDENELDKQANFEHKYNFRFEEPDKDFIKRHPRIIDNSVRKINENRKEKRLKVKERKMQEKQEKMKNVEILKELKRKEIEEKIKKIKDVTGNQELAFAENDLDDDFDPEAHDRKMKEVFNDDFYGNDEDEEKPECPDIEELKCEDWDNYDSTKNLEEIDYLPHCEDEDFNMDCEADTRKCNLQNELISNTKTKRRKRNNFKEMLKKEKPVFDPADEKSFEEYIDEYYKLDCEDMIGDLPCRFKYVETVPNDFGLTIEEILLAKNKELNQWASLKKAIQIRPTGVEKNEQKIYKQKARNEMLKRKIFVSLYGTSDDENNDEKADKEEKSFQCNKLGKNLDNKVQQKENKKSKKSKKDDNNVNNKVKTSSTEVKDETTIESKICKKQKTKGPVKITNKAHSKPNSTFKLNKSKNFKTILSQGKGKKIFNKKFEERPTKGNDLLLNDERLKAYGLNPRKIRKKKKYSKMQNKI